MRMCITFFRNQHVPSGTNMKPSFSPSLVKPNLPLRKPSSSPVTPTFGTCRVSDPTGGGKTVELGLLPLSDTIKEWKCMMGLFGIDVINSPASGDKAALPGSLSPGLTICFCNYCGHQGSFRCKRCKKTSYCSAACQTEDWKAHRHVCKPADPEPVKDKPNDNTASPVTGDGDSLLELKPDSSSQQRVYLKDLPITKVIKGIDIQASVVEFCSPSRFFLLAQSPELLEALQNIGKDLQKSCSSPSVMAYVPCVGEVCAVQFSFDQNWYRGLVQTLAADQKIANILYIDFGNEENVPVHRIRPLAANLQLFSPCAMECCVAGVVPVFGNWSDECCIAVRQLLASKTVTVQLVETRGNGRIQAVDILLSMGNYLSAFLLEHSYAVKETVNAPPTEQDMNAVVNASSEDFRCLSDGKDDKTNMEPQPQTAGGRISVVVTHFQSPSELVVQKVENSGVIQDLQLKLREHCCQVAASQNFRPAPGEICCAQFSEDKQWYRAKVLAYSSEDRVSVSYLDFGNSEVVDLGNLRPISLPLLAPPVQAMPCVLAGVQPVGESWSEECLLAVQQLVFNKILHVEIQGVHEGKALVAMIDEANYPETDVAKLLISAGLAVPAPLPVSSDQQAVEITATTEPHVSPAVCEPLVWSHAELPCGNQTVALLANVVKSPGEFYCRVDNPTDRQQLIELKAQLKQHCEAESSSFEAKVGEPCCAMFSGDGSWCRAMVKGLCEDKVTVNFVDYGYSIKVDKSHLRSITPQLLTLPFQAVRCWVTGVEPLGSEWSSEALLWFQTLVDGEQLRARVVSVTEQGYGVELESRGRNVADALVCEQLAKVPGETGKETPAKTGSGKEQEEESVKENVGTSNQTEGSCNEVQTGGRATVPLGVPSFPVDWKTVELPLDVSFQPYIAAAVSPSLFYLLGPTQVDQQKLKEMMMELAVYCSNNQATLSSAVNSRPAPGAACCAQFSADNTWYRAVVLEVGENEASVVYADFGNSEKVPFSRIVPIPVHLLLLPFQIVRCTLTGKEHFPAEWPGDLQQLFSTMLLNHVIGTVQSFDGSANVLSLTLPAERGGGHLTDMILDALHVQSTPSPSSTHKTDESSSSTSVSTTTAPDGPQPKSTPEIQSGLGNVAGPLNITGPVETTVPPAQNPEQKNNISAVSAEDPHTCDLCCLSLKTKVDHLEQLIQQQLSLIKQLVGQTK